MAISPTRTALGALAAALLVLPAATRAAEPPATAKPLGFAVTANLGGGGQLGTGSAYDPPGIFELEVGIAYDVVFGISPQLAMALGMAPGASFAIRPGVEWFIPDTPFYLRASFDASTQVGWLAWRWMLLGGGAALRITDVLGIMGEFDSGFPLSSGAGVPLLVRAGAIIRF